MLLKVCVAQAVPLNTHCRKSILIGTMAQCDLCGDSAGLFKSRHAACNEKAEVIRKSLHELVFQGSLSGKVYADLNAESKQIATENKLPIKYFKENLLQAANDAAYQIALASPVSEDDLNRLVEILQGFGIDSYTQELAQRRWYGFPSLGMSHTLWQVLNDVTPFYDGVGRMQFNLHRGEEPIFSAGAVTYAEERTVNTGSRSYGGLSLPVGAGIYYHIGNSQEHKVSGLIPLDAGEMLITSRSLYFGGEKKTLQISLAQVLRYQPYIDGVGVCEAHGAPKVFVPDFRGMDTGWFFFNLLLAITSKLNQS